MCLSDVNKKNQPIGRPENLPNQTKALLLGNMVDSDLLEESSSVGGFPGAEHIYL